MRLHGRIAQVLEKLCGAQAEAHANELAYHFSEAQALLGHEKLVRYSLLAGERALTIYAWEEALRHFQRGLEAKEGHPSWTDSRPGLDAETAALLFGLGRAQAATLERHQLGEAVDSLGRALRYYAEVGDVVRAVAIVESAPDFSAGQRIGVVELVTRALALAPPDSREAGYLLARYGDLMARVEGDYDSAQQAFGRAMTIAQREQDVAMETRILAQWAHTDYAHFRLQECLEKCLKVIELARRADEPRAEVNARHHAVLVLYWMGDLEGSRHNAVSTLALAERLRDRTWLPQALWDNAVVSLAGGDWRAARDHIDSGLAIAPQDFRLLKTRIQLEYQVGEFSQGKAHLEQLLELMRQTPPGPTFEYALPAVVIPMIARITGGLDHLDIAEAAAATALSSPYATPIFSITARTGLALLAELRGEALAVGEAYVALESKRGMMLPSAASIDRLLGLLSLTMGHLDRAAVHFEDALSLCRKAGYRPELAWTCCDYAEGLLVGATHQVAPTSFADREKAMSLLNEALTISQELGMRPLMEHAASLKEKGELQPRRGRDTSGRIASNFADGLTEREMEVLRLLASGRSNREIAEKLLISVRTAGNHVGNILAKTGTSNRTEAVAHATRNGLV